MTAGNPNLDEPQLAELGLSHAAVVAAAKPASLVTWWRDLCLAVTAWWARHAASAVMLALMLPAAGVLHGWDRHHTPGPNDDEATYVAQAWALQTHGQLAHYTYWYDHPPLGWVLLAGWNVLTFALPRGDDLIYSGRDAMLAVHLVSCVLLYLLARRLKLPRWAAGLALVLFTLSPLGLYQQRMVLLDNIGTPLLIAGWIMALTPTRRLAAYAASGLLLAAAVLVKETNLLIAAPIAVHIWCTASGHNRRFALAVFTGCFLGAGGFYPLYAALKNELLEGPGHVSLLWAIKWQLFLRGGSGSPFDPQSTAHAAILDWLHRDGALLLGALLLGIPAWRHPPARFVLATFLILLAIPLRGGYLPGPYPINLIWPAALLFAAGTYVLLRPALQTHRFAPGLVGVAGAAVLAVAFHALQHDTPFLSGDEDRGYRAARAWLLAHTTHHDVMLADNTTWMQLVQAGYPRHNIIWFWKLGPDPEILQRHPGGENDLDYVVKSPTLGGVTNTLPRVNTAIKHGTPVATFEGITILATPHHQQREANPTAPQRRGSK